MKAVKIYEALERDFITPELSDDWSGEHKTGNVREFLTDRYKERWMGLACDFTEDVKRVYTAVFPSDKVMQEILDDGAEDAMLFVHHPAVWNPALPKLWQNMNPELLKEFKARRISVYNLHVPLDNYMEQGTSFALAKALGITPVKSFLPYHGAMAGVIGKTNIQTVRELQKKFAEAVGHDVSLYSYGDDEIVGGLVGIVAGGGNEILTHQELFGEGVNVFVTGISKPKSTYLPSVEAHDFAREHKINILGGTHYSTEKFACIAMCDYFGKLGLEAKFLDDAPAMEDM
ncbi:MAG: Nif3-like dinuclear metal center hexameric protein [archaeon]|nr:Nif3-like dinuclear metal center hexameric protein [archaeon]MCR4323393.1 Nif3-like dinuclear metal center hexameric protein [Nanoarchaeota archaeon]